MVYHDVGTHSVHICGCQWCILFIRVDTIVCYYVRMLTITIVVSAGCK